VLRDLAQRARTLSSEAARHENDILAIVRSWRPDLLTQHGGTALCAWSHPGRIRSEAAFAMLADVAPVPANSGQRELAAAATSSPGISAVPPAPISAAARTGR
jgi:hypothetical protein